MARSIPSSTIRNMKEKEESRGYDIEKQPCDVPANKHKTLSTAWICLHRVCSLVAVVQMLRLLTSVDLFMASRWTSSTGDTGPKETFELRLPILYDDLVYQEVILEHSFGNSWGVPAKKRFTPPADKKFNRVVLELNTTVDGIQYDRLAHVFINDIPVWRTSTAEPGREWVYTSVEKDISKYLTLFQDGDSSVTLQLDNLIRGKLTGAFNTTLSVKYYLDPNSDDDIFNHMTVTNHPAHRVTKLIEPLPNRTPLLYYPNDLLSFSIPTVPENTTALKLALFVSGNAEEEFWYSNSLEDEKKYFAPNGHELLGHGPVRVINTYVNNKLVSVAAPEPVIFSGGISPALWRPIIGVNALDVKALEIDLSAMIPELWKTSAALDIVITNGTTNGTVGQNWIASAALLHWESEEIESAKGSVLNFKNSTAFREHHSTNAPPRMQQLVYSNAVADIKSNFTYTLKNGSEIPVELHCTSKASFVDSQDYYRYGDLQLITATVASTHSTNLQIGDISTNVKNVKFYPLVISVDTEPIIPPNVTYVANVTNVYGSRIVIDDKEVFVLESYQNGTSKFTLSPTGNSGNGSTDQTFAAVMSSPFVTFREDAQAKAVNGTLVKRDEKFWYDDLHHDMALEVGISKEAMAKLSRQVVEYQNAISQREQDESMTVDDGYVAKFPGFRQLSG